MIATLTTSTVNITSTPPFLAAMRLQQLMMENHGGNPAQDCSQCVAPGECSTTESCCSLCEAVCSTLCGDKTCNCGCASHETATTSFPFDEKCQTCHHCERCPDCPTSRLRAHHATALYLNASILGEGTAINDGDGPDKPEGMQYPEGQGNPPKVPDGQLPGEPGSAQGPALQQRALVAN